MFSENNTAVKLHENKHGGDIARGTLNNNRNSSEYNYGVSHEVSAYRAQYAFDGYIDLRTVLSPSEIHDLNMQGLRPNGQFTRYTNGVSNINTDFVKGIIEYYDGSKPIMLYDAPQRFGCSQSVWNSR
jgi:hypothetical protein